MFIGGFKSIGAIRKSDFAGLRLHDFLFCDEKCQAATVNNNCVYLWGNISASQLKKEEDCNAEGLLESYLLHGSDAFKQYDGCYAVIIAEPERLTIYRDRHGAGPQVFFNEQYFTNDLKAFRKISGFDVQPDLTSISSFLEIGYIPSPRTSLKGVRKLPAGNCLIYENGKIELKSLYEYTDFLGLYGTTRMTVEEATEEYERLHKQAIQRRIADKNDVALLLSGGYDSGGNLSTLRDIYSGNAKGFSVGFKNNPWTEVPLARLMAKEFDVDFYDYEIDGSEIDFLPEIIGHLGDPFQEGGLMVNYCAMKMVGSHRPEVVLGGDGNDQHFGTSGKELALNHRLRKSGAGIFQNMFSAISKNNLFENDNILFRARFHNDKILHVLRCDGFGFKPHQQKQLLKAQGAIHKHDYANGVPSVFRDYNQFYLARNFHIDIKQVINEVILFKASKMAELFENQIAFPYMDADVYNFLMTLPREYKLKNSFEDIMKGKGVSKYLHKAYLKPKLPNEITERKKQGGFAPLSIFLSDPVKREKIKRFIVNSNAAKELFNASYIDSVFAQFDQIEKTGGYWFWYKQVKSTQLFNLLVIAIWWEIMIENNQRALLSDYFLS